MTRDTYNLVNGPVGIFLVTAFGMLLAYLIGPWLIGALGITNPWISLSTVLVLLCIPCWSMMAFLSANNPDAVTEAIASPVSPKHTDNFYSRIPDEEWDLGGHHYRKWLLEDGNVHVERKPAPPQPQRAKGGA